MKGRKKKGLISFWYLKIIVFPMLTPRLKIHNATLHVYLLFLFVVRNVANIFSQGYRFYSKHHFKASCDFTVKINACECLYCPLSRVHLSFIEEANCEIAWQ